MKIIAIILYFAACYLVAYFGRKKKIGFGDAFLLSMLNPIVGAIVVYFSADKDAPEKPPKKRKIKPELTDSAQDEFSDLLQKYHRKEITKEEFEDRSASLQ